MAALKGHPVNRCRLRRRRPTSKLLHREHSSLK